MPWQSLPEALYEERGSGICSRERPARERGRGINITRIFRGFAVQNLEKGLWPAILPLSSHKSLCLWDYSFFYLKFYFPSWPPCWLPHFPQVWPSLAILFKTTALSLPCSPSTKYFSLFPLLQLDITFFLIYLSSLKH